MLRDIGQSLGVQSPDVARNREATAIRLANMAKSGDRKALAEWEDDGVDYDWVSLARISVRNHRPCALKAFMRFTPHQDFFLLALREAAWFDEDEGAQECLALVLDANGDNFDINEVGTGEFVIEKNDALGICIEADNQRLFDWCLRQSSLDINKNDPLTWAIWMYNENPYYLETLLARKDVLVYNTFVLCLIILILWATGTAGVMFEAARSPRPTTFKSELLFLNIGVFTLAAVLSGFLFFVFGPVMVVAFFGTILVIAFLLPRV
jgi:hypothetical protein